MIKQITRYCYVLKGLAIDSFKDPESPASLKLYY